MSERDERRAELEVVVRSLRDADAKVLGLVASATKEDRVSTADKAMRAHVMIADALVAVSAAYASDGVRPA